MVLQNLFKEYPSRSPSDFVGREAQLKDFRQKLNLSLSERHCFIINVSGQAGVGKTELLHQYRKLVDQVGALSVTTAETETDVPTVMGKIAEQCKQKGHVLRKFSDRYRTYLQCLKRLEADPDKPQGLSKAFGQAMTKVGMGFVRQAPGIGAFVGVLDENTLAAQGGEWFAFIAKKLTNIDEVRLMQSPIEELTPLFLQGLRDLSARHLPVLFFDAYERISVYLDKWLRDILGSEQYGKPPENLLIVIAGQQELNRTNWEYCGSEVIRQPLEPFTEHEALDFLKRKGITDESLVAEILKLSERLPFLLNDLALRAPTTPTAVVDRAEDYVDRVLRWIEEPQKRKLVLDAALARYVNQDVVATLTSPEQAEVLFDWLIKGQYVNKKTKAWCYESLMRKLMVRHKRQRTVLEWVTQHEKLAQLYQTLCDVQGLEAKTSQYNLTWQTYQHEKLYHQLCQAPQKFLNTALLEFLAAFKRQPLKAHCWAETIQQAGEETEFDELKQWGEQMVRGLSAYDQEPYTDAIALFTTFLKQAKLEPEWQAKVLHWRGSLYRRSKQYAQALADLSETIHLMPQEAEYSRDRGLVYLFDGQYPQAIADLTKAIELNAKDAKAIAYRGMVYFSQSNYFMAIGDFTNALTLQPDFQGVLVSRAVAYRELERYEAALDDLNLALELVPEDLSAIAQRGKTYQEMGSSEEALSDLNQVLTQNSNNVGLLISRGIVYQQLEHYEEALTDFNRVLELEADNLDALANRGEIYRRMGRYEEAIADFNQVIKRSPDDAWSIGIRGTAYRQFGYFSQALKDYDRAIALEPHEDWWYYSRALTYQMISQPELVHTDLHTAIQLGRKYSQRVPRILRYRLNLALYYLAAGEIEESAAIYRETLGKASSLLRRGAVRELKELLVVIPASSMVEPNSPQAKFLTEVLQSHGIVSKTE